MVDRGWSRRATQTINPSKGGAPYKVQATIWKDKRIIGWLHTDSVTSESVQAKRRVKGKRYSVRFRAPRVQSQYSTGFNGVDLSDKDSAKYSTSLRSNRWHLRVVFSKFDRIIHAMFIIACNVVSVTFLSLWNMYKSKHNGRKKFQCHVGIAVMSAGIKMDWKPNNDGVYDEEDKPKWMPGTLKNGKYHPCDCGICFFCKNKFTSTIAHGKVTSMPQTKKCVNAKYVTVTRSYCQWCTVEARKNYPNTKNAEELRKIEVNGKKVIKRPYKGCSECKIAMCPRHFAMHQ